MKFHHRSKGMFPITLPVAELTERERSMLSTEQLHIPQLCEELDGLPLAEAYAKLGAEIDESVYTGFVYNGTGVSLGDGKVLENMKDIEKMQRLLAACGSFHMLPGQ